MGREPDAAVSAHRRIHGGLLSLPRGASRSHRRCTTAPSRSCSPRAIPGAWSDPTASCAVLLIRRLLTVALAHKASGTASWSGRADGCRAASAGSMAAVGTTGRAEGQAHLNRHLSEGSCRLMGLPVLRARVAAYMTRPIWEPPGKRGNRALSVRAPYEGRRGHARARDLCPGFGPTEEAERLLSCRRGGRAGRHADERPAVLTGPCYFASNDLSPAGPVELVDRGQSRGRASARPTPGPPARSDQATACPLGARRRSCRWSPG